MAVAGFGRVAAAASDLATLSLWVAGSSMEVAARLPW
jgi:hypothetical protein